MESFCVTLEARSLLDGSMQTLAHCEAPDPAGSYG
jgi:hypothetical protein